MLRERDKIIKYIKDNYSSKLRTYTADELEEIMFDCHNGDMEFFIEELIASAGNGDSSLNISYYDDNAWCICLVGDVEYEYEDMSPADVATILLSRELRVNLFKEKFLKIKEQENDN